MEYDNLGRITSLPGKYPGGGDLKTSYYTSDLTHTQSQDGITNTYELDASGRQRERIRVKGEEESTAIYHYAAGSDTPSWTEEIGEEATTWTRHIQALGGGVGALETSNGEVTLQLADMHGTSLLLRPLIPKQPNCYRLSCSTSSATSSRAAFWKAEAPSTGGSDPKDGEPNCPRASCKWVRGATCQRLGGSSRPIQSRAGQPMPMTTQMLIR